MSSISRSQRYWLPSTRRLLLVDPVGGDAELGDLVHLAGADLHLDPLPLRPDHAGMHSGSCSASGSR